MLHEQDVGYTFLGYRSSTISSLELAEQSVANISLDQEDIDGLLSANGLRRAIGDTATYRKYIVEAYLNGSLVDRIVFVCRYA